MILSMTTIMPWIGVLVQEKIKTGSNDLSSYLASSIYRRIEFPIIGWIQYLVVAKKFGFGFGFMPEQNMHRFYASLEYTHKFPIETDFP